MRPIRAEHALIRAPLEWLLAVRDPDGEEDGETGGRRLTYSRRFLWTACVVWIVANGAFSWTTLALRGDTPAWVWGMAVFGALWVVSLSAAWDAFVTRLSVSDEGLVIGRRALARSVVPWSAITKVRYSRLGSGLVFRAPGYPTVRVSIYRNGLGALATGVRRHLGAHGGSVPGLIDRLAANPR